MKIFKILPFLLSFSLFFEVYSQKTITLNVEKLSFTPTFSIDNVKDERLKSDNIGNVFTSATAKETISIKGGVVNVVKKMLLQTIPSNKISISYTILELTISESRLPNGNISGEMLLRVAFERLGKKDTVLLTETTTSTSFLRSDNQMPAGKYEAILTSLFIKSLDYFDKWLALNGSKSEALAKGIKIVFMSEPTENIGDTVYYHARNIAWDDFRGKPTNSRYGAAIFSSFAYGASFRVIDGFIVATIQSKTYMVPGMSWVIPAAQDAYGLSHEQLHFDITKLVVERFKKKITAMKADLVIDLNSMIQYEYLESYREMNQLQNQYDNETQHSLNQQKQAEWARKVKDWLEEIELNKNATN
jgi:hypothetical protein